MKTEAGLLAGQLLARFEATRERTDQIFALASPEAHTLRPIPLRHPLIFYRGHLDAFNYNTLFRGVLGEGALDPALDVLFARGIDPEDEQRAAGAAVSAWPEEEAIAAYQAAVGQRLSRFFAEYDLSRPAHLDLLGAKVLYLLLEHELMHQETLCYIIHQLPPELKRAPVGALNQKPAADPARLARRPVVVPDGHAWLGALQSEFPFTWDNEHDPCESWVPAFAIDANNVTNAEFQAFIAEGGYTRRALWDDAAWDSLSRSGRQAPFFWRQGPDGWLYRGFFAEQALDPACPAVVTQAEAQAYARSRGLALPTEAEWHRAAFGDQQSQPHPWGSAPPSPAHGNFGFQHWDPVPVGSYPAGDSPLGVSDMMGNGWEWTASPFAPFAGFRADPAYPGYSADFFDGKHVVLKGASWATPGALVRRSFRNWFFPSYPYVYATFRCVNRG